MRDANKRPAIFLLASPAAAERLNGFVELQTSGNALRPALALSTHLGARAKNILEAAFRIITVRCGRKRHKFLPSELLVVVGVASCKRESSKQRAKQRRLGHGV